MKKFFNIGKNELFKINRSITGKGTLKTLKIIKKNLKNFKIKKIKSGTKAFDWRVPPEWNVSEAFVLDKNNNRIIDFEKNNLHLVGYSKPLNKILKKKDLFRNIYYLKSLKNAIPYVTSYYKKRWGFCITYNNFQYLRKKYSSRDKFKVSIKSNFKNNGYLNYGEVVLKGKSNEEIIISTYICHPSMANNELSGPIVAMGLINYFQKKKLNRTLRFIFIPETIGSITYLSKNIKSLKKNVIGGFNLSCIGDERNYSCMFSKEENMPSDEAIIEAFEKLEIGRYKIFSFLERGSDERQYNSPGIDLPISSIFRSKYGEFPEYHTSLDDFKLVTLKGITGGYKVAKESITILQKKIIPKNLILCEPNMGKRNMYPTLSTLKKNNNVSNYMNFLQYADGRHSLNFISKKIQLNFKDTKKIYLKLKSKKLVQ
jgi:aminopeptidase-like protein